MFKDKTIRPIVQTKRFVETTLFHFIFTLNQSNKPGEITDKNNNQGKFVILNQLWTKIATKTYIIASNPNEKSFTKSAN